VGKFFLTLPLNDARMSLLLGIERNIMSEIRAKTVEEVRAEFIQRVKAIANHWATEQEPMSLKFRCDGVASSILALIDGAYLGFPAIDMMAAPHDEDKEFSIENGENWYEKNQVFNDCQLHEMFHSK
jgi:hypothetical protein